MKNGDDRNNCVVDAQSSQVPLARAVGAPAASSRWPSSMVASVLSSSFSSAVADSPRDVAAPRPKRATLSASGDMGGAASAASISAASTGSVASDG